MQIDLVTLFLAGAGIALAVVIAVVTGTLAARLFFHASGLDR
jgi:ABC-type dipeptide/oligopeptide/nickel transport system permease component